jgi:rSAM/selenodomain-associated transferase 1
MTAVARSGSPRLLVFARAPVPGFTKTRLIPALGPEGAAALHTRMLRHVLAEGATVAADRELWCAADANHPVLQQLATEFGYRRCTQSGADLGERMLRAFMAAGASGFPAVLMGSDAPGLGRDRIAAAIRELQSGADVVLVPALDGGYVLIGLSQPVPWLFSGITWGGSEVAAHTLARCQELSLRSVLLDHCADIDSPQDLTHCPQEWVHEALRAGGRAQKEVST